MSQLASSVNIIRERSVLRKIPLGAVLVMGLQGVTERGPVNEAVLTFDFPDWQETFGGFTADGFSALVARSFFLNGGTRIRQSRIVHHTDATDPTTKMSDPATVTLQTPALSQTAGSVTSTNAEPFALTPGDTLVISPDGGANVTATFNAAAATLTAGNTATYNLAAGGETLTVSVDGGSVQTVTFQTSFFGAPGAATAAEVAAAINGQIVGASADVDSNAPRLTADSQGTGSSIQVTGGTANTALGFSTTASAGTGNVANIGAVTASEATGLVNALAGVSASVVAGGVLVSTATAGASGSIQVLAASTADDELGFTNAVVNGTNAGAVDTLRVTARSDGEWGNAVSIEVTDSPTSGADRFSLIVNEGAVTLERIDDLTMDDTSPRFVETIINATDGTGSTFILVEDLDANTTPVNQRPANGSSGNMTGGDDGLVGLVDADFNGGEGVNGKVGLRVFDKWTDIDVIASPDRATSSHHNAMITYCDVTREGVLFAILDPPAGLSASQMATYVESTAAISGLTENAAIYWPRVKVSNPNQDVFGTDATVTVPPSGVIAGIMARTDASKVGGVFEQPAGLDAPFLPRGIEDLETDEVLDIAARELLFPLNVNPISQEQGTPIFVDGARNLDISGSFSSIGVIRGVIFMTKRLRPALAFLRHRNLKPRLYNEGRNTASSFLNDLVNEEAIEAFSADFSNELNTPAVRKQRRLKARLGVKFFDVAEFVDVFIGPDSDDLQAQFAA